MTEQRTWTVPAPNAQEATEVAKRQARAVGLRIRTVVRVTPGFGSADKAGLPDKWAVTLAVGTDG